MIDSRRDSVRPNFFQSPVDPGDDVISAEAERRGLGLVNDEFLRRPVPGVVLTAESDAWDCVTPVCLLQYTRNNSVVQ